MFAQHLERQQSDHEIEGAGHVGGGGGGVAMILDAID